jgi:hypothetical protein
LNGAWVKQGSQGVDSVPDAPLQSCKGVAVGNGWNGSVLRYAAPCRRFWGGTSTFPVNPRSGGLRLLVLGLFVYVGSPGLFRVSERT